MDMIIDDHDAKFKQLWNFRGEEDLAFVECLKKKKNNQTYTSPKIQNEILKDISPSILRDVVPKAIKSWDYHSITLNESSDIFNKEQVVFCVCWVDEDLISHEDFIGLYEMEKTDAKRYGRCD